MIPARVFVIRSSPQHLKPLREKLSRFLRDSGLPAKAAANVLVALGEACTNSMRHSYGGEPGRLIRVRAEDRKDRVVFRIRDYGRKINLKAVRPPVLPPARAGGLGIYFMKSVMDEVRYETGHARGNELILVKHKDLAA